MKQTSGLKFEVSLKKADESLLSKLWHGIAAGTMLCGWFLLFSDTVGNLGVVAAIAFYALLLPIVSEIVSGFSKNRFLLYSVPSAAALLTMIISFHGTANGAIGVYNSLLNILGKQLGEIMPLIEQLGELSVGDTVSFYIFAISLVFLILTLSETTLPLLFSAICSAAMLIFFFYVGSINKIGFVLTLIGISALFLIGRSTPIRNVKGFGYRITASVCCAAVLIVSVSVNGNVSFWNTAQKAISAACETLRYGRNILPEGDFTQINNFEPSSEVQLEVVMSEPESYYLRGYVGEIYNGNGWSSLENKKLYEYSDLFYWLHKSDFYGQTQLGDAANLTGQNETENRVIVRNLNASSKYIYAPYETLGVKDASYESLIGDRYFKSEYWGSSNYTLTAASNQVKQYTTVAAELYESEKNSDEKTAEYLKNEAHYNVFVYENYLDIPEETRNLLENLLGEYETESSHLDYGEAKQNILSYLTSNMTYSIEAEPTDGDFLDSFLQQTGNGYSVHFATAAAMMFRYYGIPARYVEGFLITPDDVDGAVADSAIEIDETHAHAWVEFYQDGVGWIPFEVTPKYLDVMEKADDLTGVNSQPNEAEQPEEDPEKSENKDEVQGMQELRRQKAKRTAVKIITAVICALLLLFIAALIIIAMINRKKLMKLKELFGSNDARKAVLSLFGYATSFFEKESADINSVYLSQKDEQFQNAFTVYEKARFSEHSISEDERKTVKEFTDKTVEDFEKRRSKRQRFTDKYFRYLY